MIEINLLPGAKRKRGGGFKLALPDFKALSGLAKDPWLIAAIVGWLLVLGVATPLFLRSKGQVDALQPRLEKAVSDSARYDQLVRAKLAYEAARDSLIAQINVIKSIDRDRYIWPHILDAIAKSLPAYTWLDGITPRGNEGDVTAGTLLQITGKTVDMQAMTRFMRILEESQFIEGVELITTNTVTDQTRDVTVFTINARYQQPDSTTLTWQPLQAALVQGVRSGGGARRR